MGFDLTFDLQAFGVGALEDDDEDVYHRDSMSKYDTVLGGEEPGDGLYGWTAPQQYTKRRGNRTWKTPGKSWEQQRLNVGRSQTRSPAALVAGSSL